MAAPLILLVLSEAQAAHHFEQDVLRPAGFEVIQAQDADMAVTLVQSSLPDLAILGEVTLSGSGLDLAGCLLKHYPSLPVILLANQNSESLILQAMRIGVMDFLISPVFSSDVQQAVYRVLKRRQALKDWIRQEVHENTKTLQKKVTDLEALQRIGRKVTALLDLDNVLTAVVDAAVELTGAEEGCLLLLDETSGELYMRAARNFNEDFVRTFRIHTQDSLPGEVLRTGKPVMIDTGSLRKIKTTYLVHALMYVPLVLQERVIGVLGVDNRQAGRSFSEYHFNLISTLADYAAIAIENARLYARSEIERSKLGTILAKIQDGVIVVDLDRRLMLMNRTAEEVFRLEGKAAIGKPVREIITQPDLLEILNEEKARMPYHSEVKLEDGRIFNAQATPIPEVGLAVILQDITHLKELDRIKSDFVNTVSHDLRSPLTAILGYVELIERVGPTNPQQKEFIRRVQVNVQNITALINDLLDLGRIEAGFDSRKETISLPKLIYTILDGLKNQAIEKSLKLSLDIPQNLPPVLGNPLRLRQMLANLVDNAIKYTPDHGRVSLSARAEAGQIILQISDSGPGIPLSDQPYIFDKFYRASNVSITTPGTGLGLAIVKSIVENHQGRIWVESNAGQGSMFVVVLPVYRTNTIEVKDFHPVALDTL